MGTQIAFLKFTALDYTVIRQRHVVQLQDYLQYSNNKL